jgi:hypothetical protein
VGHLGSFAGPNTPFGAHLGASFLRSVYATFDLDDITIAVSEVKYTNAEDIVKIRTQCYALGGS